MRVLIAAVLLVHLAAAASWAATPKACRRCHSVCGDPISACIAAATASCPSTPRAKAHRCASKVKRHCKKTTIAACIDSCRRTGSAVCRTPPPTACVPYTSTCTAVPVTPAVTSSTSSQTVYRFLAHTGSPGPGGCCVIDTCSGTTQFNTTAGPLGAQYDENIDMSAGLRALGDTEISAGCSVPTDSSVYGLSNIYSVRFSIFPPEFPLPPTPVDWPAPYTLAPGDLGVSVDTTTDTISSDAMISFKPSTWRLVSAGVSVNKVCAEQQLM